MGDFIKKFFQNFLQGQMLKNLNFSQHKRGFSKILEEPHVKIYKVFRIKSVILKNLQGPCPYSSSLARLRRRALANGVGCKGFVPYLWGHNRKFEFFLKKNCYFECPHQINYNIYLFFGPTDQFVLAFFFPAVLKIPEDYL